jgi:NAD(P)-dependent dehydrogenase (short-subunit alcohol dehydrogenase family)
MLLEGKVAIVTGAGRGIGREEALLLAKHGAAVVVNDLGAHFDGTGGSASPAQEVVDEIKKNGGQAVANGESVTDFAGAKRIVECALDNFKKLNIVVNNAGILRDRMIFNMAEGDSRPPEGQLQHESPCVRVLARAAQGR